MQNILLIIIVVLFAICIWRGCTRGFFRSVLIAGATVLAIFFASSATPYVSNFIYERTNLQAQISESVYQKLISATFSETEDTQSADSVTADTTANTQSADSLTQELSRNAQTAIISELPIPEKLKLTLISSNNPQTYAELCVENFYDYLATYISRVIIKCMSYVIIQIMITVGLMILLYSTKWLTEIPILNGIDKTGGCILGIIHALAITWSFFILATLIGSTKLGLQIFAQIDGNPVLSWLFDHNIILDAITGTFGQLGFSMFKL